MTRIAADHRAHGSHGHRGWRIAGCLLLVHFVITCIIKIDKGLVDDVLWMSHVALPLAGIGLVLGWSWLVAAALTGILVTHGLWLFDLIAWLLGFGFPLSITDYMAEAPFSTWLSTGHHLYLMPLLVWYILREGRYPWRALGVMILLFALLTLASILFTSYARNVNRVHGIVPDFRFPPFLWANDLRSESPDGPRGNPAFLLALNGLSVVILFLPAALCLHILTTLRRRITSATRKGRAH